MERPWSDAMRVGLVSFMAFPELGSGNGDVVSAMETITRDPFFQQVDVTRVNDPDARCRAIRIARDASLSVGFGAHPIILGEGINLNALEDSARRAAVERLTPFIDEACEWNAEAFVVLSGKDPGHERRPDAVDALVTSLVELGERSAARDGPPIVLETFDRVPFAKNCLAGPTDLCVDIARKVRKRTGDFGLLLDLSHLPLLDEDPARSLALAKDCLSYVHVGNCVRDERHSDHDAYGDHHPPFGIPEGANGPHELREFLRALFDVAFLGKGRRPVVGFEIKPPAGSGADEVFANAKDTLAEAWRALETSLES